MSEQKPVLSLLADHMIGDSISEHDGVTCCPAIKMESDEKYIVKIISIPTSQNQLEALLLTGAYPNKEAAMAYFKELTESTAQEALLLQKLSKLEGFLPYEGWELAPAPNSDGYRLYLLGTYKPTLARYLKRNPMTHLAAINLGLDLCAALSVCRRMGYLYVDLKPENIFLSGDREYRIGDLGFVALDSLKYASLPNRYLSVYTAPEITDAYSSLNTTLDTYAVGLILYQVYNNGELPEFPKPGELLPAPAYADYELAEIILKACHPDPAQRWQDPTEMGQALVSYMQRNTVNDVPIIPPVVPQEEKPIPSEEVPNEEEPEQPTEEAPLENESEQPGEPEAPVEEDSAAVTVAEESPAAPPAEEPASEEPEVTPEDVSETPAAEIIDQELLTEDETAPTEQDGQELADTSVTEEVSAMLAQADELIAHPMPAPVVAPEVTELPEPDPIEPEEPEEIDAPDEELPVEEPVEEPQPELQIPEEQPESPAAAVAVQAPPAESQDRPVKQKKHGGLIALLVTILVLLLLACGAFYYYENYYLQLVQGIRLEGNEDQLTVYVDTEIDNSLLTVYCIDTYGNKLTQPVSNNTAVFTGLNPGSNYKISLSISGFHELIGNTTAQHTTASQTSIVSFTAKAGDQDGSVILNFSVQGPENTNWRVRYSAPGVEEQVAECNKHMATITGLEPGKVYTFKLESVADLYVVGNDTITFTATKVIYPENLAIRGFIDGALVADWAAPEGVTVNSWTVRCYNSEGVNVTMTVTEPKVAIPDLDPAQSYTVEVKAEGMMVGGHDKISANSLTFKDLVLDHSTPGQLVITWYYEGTAPSGGWRLFYTIDGEARHVVECAQNTCTISPLVPGAQYKFSFELPEDITVFGGTAEYDVPPAPTFSDFGITADDLTFRMCRTPKDVNWKWYSLLETDFYDSYAPNTSASFVISMKKMPQLVGGDIKTLFIIRDENGRLVGSPQEGRTRSWHSMWSSFNGFYGTELDMPTMPQTPGNYTVEIYFNNALVTTEAFAIS